MKLEQKLRANNAPKTFDDCGAENDEDQQVQETWDTKELVSSMKIINVIKLRNK